MAKNKQEKPYGVTSGGEKLAYALGDLGSNFVWTFCSSWLTLYYTDSVLLAAVLPCLLKSVETAELSVSHNSFNV